MVQRAGVLRPSCLQGYLFGGPLPLRGLFPRCWSTLSGIMQRCASVMRIPFRLSLAALLFVTLLTGCSFSFVYRQLDWFVPWYVSDYIELDESQSSELERRVLRQLEWHCSTQLPHYAEWFRQLQGDPDALSREQLEQHYLQSRIFWHELMGRVADNAAQILVTTSDAQIEELLQSLERKNREVEKEYSGLSEAQRRERRKARLLRLLKRWLGEVNEQQLGHVDNWSEALGEVDLSGWMNNRRHWQQQLLDAIRQRDDINRLNERLHLLLVEPERLWSDSDRVEYSRRKALTLDMLAAVAQAMTPRQRNHLSDRLLSWAEDFETLACVEEGAEPSLSRTEH